MGATISYVASAGAAMLQMALFCAVGVVFGIFPRAQGGLLTPEALKSMSVCVYWLYTPALLMATFGSKLSLDILRDTLGIMLWSLIHAGVNFLIGGVIFPKIVPVERPFLATFRLAVTFNNGASVPLLIFSGLVRSAELHDDTGAYDRAVVYIFAYVCLWNLIFWSLGSYLMETSAAELAAAAAAHTRENATPQTDGAATSLDTKDLEAGAARIRLRDDVIEPPGYDMTPLDIKSGVEGAADWAQPSNHREAGAHTSNLHEQVLSGARAATVPFVLRLRRVQERAWHTLSDPWTWHRFRAHSHGPSPATTRQKTNVSELLKKAFLTPAVIGIVIGVIIGVWEDMRVAMFTRGGSLQAFGDVIALLGQPSIPLSNLILAGSLFHGTRDFYARHKEQFHRWLPWPFRHAHDAGHARAGAAPSPAFDETSSTPAQPEVTAVFVPSASATIVPIPTDMIRHMASLRGAPNIAPGSQVMLLTFRPNESVAGERMAERGEDDNAVVRHLHHRLSERVTRRAASCSERSGQHASDLRLQIADEVETVLQGIRTPAAADDGLSDGAGRTDRAWTSGLDAHVHVDEQDPTEAIMKAKSRRVTTGRARVISEALCSGTPVVMYMDTDADPDAPRDGPTGIRRRGLSAGLSADDRFPSASRSVNRMPADRPASQARHAPARSAQQGRLEEASPTEHSHGHNGYSAAPTSSAAASSLSTPMEVPQNSVSPVSSAEPNAVAPQTSAPTAHDGVSMRTAASLLLLRLVVCPVVLFLLFVLAESMRIPVLAPGPGAQDVVLRLVVLVEAASPSAQSVLLLCQTTGNLTAAKELSLIYVVMYPLSLVTLTIALTVAMALVFQS